MIIFYDGTCPLCNRAVRFLLAKDKKRLFYFASLQGTTASDKLQHLTLKQPTLDTLILYIDDEHILIEGKAILRILWFLGGTYALVGWLSFLPSFLFDLIYKGVAKYRFRLFSCREKVEPTDRFLP